MTSSVGFDKPLYILSFDHRGSFLSALGPDSILTEEHAAQVDAAAARLAGAKHVVYDGFEAALTTGVHKGNAGILVDEEFGADILRHAAARGYSTVCPAESPGQKSSTSSTVRILPNTSRLSTQLSARCRSATTLRVTRI